MVSGEIMYSIIKDIADSWWKSDLIRCCFSHLFCEHNKFLLVAAFLRNERMHPNFVLACLQAQEIINVLQRLQIGCSSSFSVASGFVHLLCHSCSLLWLFSLFLIFWVFIWTGFSLWLHLTKKGLQSQCRLERYFYSWVKTNYIIAKHVYTRNLLFRSFAIACFDSGTWMDSCQEATWQVCVTELGQQLFLFISGNIQISCQLHRVCFLRYW